ncbi:MAG TPA: M67 family metallopeptidase [Terriglobales bacterium]|nr:M67 family metallopeptidase [Terriglobales bacterium]
MLTIPAGIYRSLREHGEATYPHECCGILLGQMDGDVRIVTSAVPCGNVQADSPEKRYDIDPKDLIRIQSEGRDRGEDVIGFYHSHPDHPAQWSATDLAEAHWIGCSYVITSVEKGKATVTNSFELAGTLEEDKRFVAETLQVCKESRAGERPSLLSDLSMSQRDEGS